MKPFFESLFSQFQAMHDEIRQVITDLPVEALDWKPGDDMNSMTVLVVHVCGSERYWVGDVVLGEPSNWSIPPSTWGISKS